MGPPGWEGVAVCLLCHLGLHMAALCRRLFYARVAEVRFKGDIPSGKLLEEELLHLGSSPL